jgi:hypothetical protein
MVTITKCNVAKNKKDGHLFLTATVISSLKPVHTSGGKLRFKALSDTVPIPYHISDPTKKRREGELTQDEDTALAECALASAYYAGEKVPGDVVRQSVTPYAYKLPDGTKIMLSHTDKYTDGSTVDSAEVPVSEEDQALGAEYSD